MPRRSVDQGVKPFEFRTGVGGLPSLGGMFRSGDPATIPPHKFHMIVNMRKLPAGLISRPGLALEHDTGVRECIDGLTEDSAELGGDLMLYPGAQLRNPDDPNPGDPAFNQASFRIVSPGTYSEFVTVLYGPAAVTRGAWSPVLATTAAYGAGPTWLTQPFIFRGQVVQFALVSKEGVTTMALLGMNLPPRSFLQASDCFRTTGGPTGDPACPGTAGLPAPGGDLPPLWPYQHPVGSAEVLTYFDNAFGPGFDSYIDTTLEQSFIVIPERVDDPVTGVPGVRGVLYFIVKDGTSEDRKLVRWDGVRQTTEYTPPAGLYVYLGKQKYGPILGRAALSGSAEDWAAFRTEAGTWSVIDGAGWTVGTGPDDFTGFDIGGGEMVEWGGRAHMLIAGEWSDGASGSGSVVQMHPQAATEFTALRSAPSATLFQDATQSWERTVVHPQVLGHLVYAVGYENTTVSDFQESAARLWIGDFLTPTVPHIDAIEAYQITLNGNFSAGNPIWLQVVGDRVYVGGKFAKDPITGVNDGLHHGVYDVTEASVKADIRLVYRVNAADQTFDSAQLGLPLKDRHERYSVGCLEANPGEDSGDEGFGENL
jgi:hypothetical protein